MQMAQTKPEKMIFLKRQAAANRIDFANSFALAIGIALANSFELANRIDLAISIALANSFDLAKRVFFCNRHRPCEQL